MKGDPENFETEDKRHDRHQRFGTHRAVEMVDHYRCGDGTGFLASVAVLGQVGSLSVFSDPKKRDMRS